MKLNRVRSRSRIWKPVNKFQSRELNWWGRFKRNSRAFCGWSEYEKNRIYCLPAVLFVDRICARLGESVQAAQSARADVDYQHECGSGSSEKQECELPETYVDR